MVGVIIPTYKAKDVLPHALDSLVAQTKKMFLVCISVDGDDEDYSEIVKEYTRRGLKIKLIRSETNGGPGMARQAGINAMAPMCDYVMFLDADDLLMPQAVERLYSEAKRNNADAIQTSVVADATAAPDHVMVASQTPVTWTHGKIYRTKYLLDNKIEFIPEIRLNEDSYFNVVAMNCTKQKFMIDEITYYWSDNPNSLTRQDRGEFFLKSWQQYILSQVRGMERIYEIRPEAMNGTLLGLTCINVFWHFTQARNRGLDETIVRQYLAEWKDIPKFQEIFNDSEFWQAVSTNLKASVMENGNLIFPKQNFADWVKEFLVAGD